LTLTPSEVRVFYDRFGKKQDAQSFYEDPALDDLVAHGHFAEAAKVFEFGCGTGRLAARLLAEDLPVSATYIGCDLSATMVNLATARLAPYGERARAFQSDGTTHLPLADNSVDRVISTYVLDLLPDTDIEEVLREAHRVLIAGGKLCLVSLTTGATLPSRIVSSMWTLVFRLRPSLVGGCRPIRLGRALNPSCWELEHRKVVSAFGVASEVAIARARDSAQPRAAGDRMGEPFPA
jgi:ubiquinone/menaquinone biosynthesis C-methylase UbiE